MRSLESELEKLREVVENPVPVRVILAEPRYRAMKKRLEEDGASIFTEAKALTGETLHGLRIDVVASYGEVVYSDGSRRAI